MAMSMSNAQIVEGCRRRDAKAQRALYDATAPMALGVCMRYAANRDEAQDLMQDAYIKVFERIGQLRDADRLEAWVYSIMVNTGVQHCRKAHRETVVDDLEPVASAVDFDPYSAHDLVAAMQQLSPRHRLAFNLFAVEGYSLDEVAQQMKCSNVNVRVMLNRARNKMREFLR